MKYSFWDEFKEIIPYELQMNFDIRLFNVSQKIDDFFKTVIVNFDEKRSLKFYLTGSCIKANSFRDIDFIFPCKDDMEMLNKSLNQDYFKYKNNSYTYEYKNDIFHLFFREKFENAKLEYLVSNFDFDSTRIAFECVLDTKTKQVSILKADIREEFIVYCQTRKNNLKQISINPFVSLQRALHFLKRGDDVPYDVFLEVCSKIAEIEVNKDDNKEKFYRSLQGNSDKLVDIKASIDKFIDKKR